MMNKSKGTAGTSSGADQALPSPQVEITPDVKMAVEEAQVFVSYIAWQDDIEFDDRVLKTLIESKYKVKANTWSAEDEFEFWVNFDKLAEIVSPVTIESLRATLPGLGKETNGRKPKPTEASRAVRRYRSLAIGSLFFLLLFQIYWFIGMDLTKNLNQLFKERDKVNNQIQQIESIPTLKDDARVAFNNRSLPQLKNDAKILNQRLDANYEILRHWNRVWQFNQQFDAKITEYTVFKYGNQRCPLRLWRV